MEREIIKEIEKLREEMVNLSIKYGMKNPRVLEISRKIDKLHIELLKLQKENNYKNEHKGDSNIYEMKFALCYTC